ncbi:type II secretion system protein [Paucibacter sp. TC2R-5]|uniref:type II secretion system protein n=1 Tax=Paucibacter sp. TC2R-5 TaxID=2893555 RepID=UPI0021E50EEA|nr:type II secretion system protein [Paucibacter sp. TC2R-5]MCV2359129.1 type II secretion system protein [Paucibacter sp. TC2R-5]
MARKRAAEGFSYLGVLILVAVFGLVGAASVKLAAAQHRRVAEQALLETGAAFSQALASYARATPAGQADAPPSLQDLLRDPRFPGTVRHLRKIFVDPMTGGNDWGLERDSDDGAIIAVFSLSCGKPLKIAGFDGRFPDFNGKTFYREWKFKRPIESGVTAGGLRKGLIDPRALQQNADSSEGRNDLGKVRSALPPCGEKQG